MTSESKAMARNPSFEGIRQTDAEGNEFWFARDLGPMLEYQGWRNFARVIDKAKTACEMSGQRPADHFADVSKMVDIGSGAQRHVDDVRLSRYACYLIVQNGDPAKPVIAHGQTYFALQTRRQEIADSAKFAELSEDERRLVLRNELARHNKNLAATAQQAGVVTPVDYAVFQDHGYKGLYGGLGAKDIHAFKGLKKSQKILDHMGSTELAANLFRATQAEEKLRRDGTRDKVGANRTHHDVGAKVRQTIKDLGGTMPEKLPTPDKSIHQIERIQQKLPTELPAEEATLPPFERGKGFNPLPRQRRKMGAAK
ncbi:MAG: DNA damage-inducible protein D [Acidobacteriota bacterium]